MTCARGSGLAALVATLAVGLAGCSAAGERGGLSALLPAVLPPGMSGVHGPTGPLPAAAAASATTVPADRAQAYLSTHGYQQGYERVWRRGPEFVSAIVLRFFAADDAQGWMGLVFDDLAGDIGYAPFTDPQLPAARGWSLTSEVAGTTKFCFGEWFVDGRDAFAVTRCADHPLDAPAVTGLARQVRAHELRVRTG